MKVQVSEIPEEGLTLHERFNPGQMELDAPDLKFTAPLEISATFRKGHEAVGVEVGVQGQTERICGRCLEHFANAYGERFRLDYSVKGILVLDLTGDIRQEILLSLPVRTLCREDCLGLCPQCGTNRNERSCTHGPA